MMFDRRWASLSPSVVGDHAACAGSQVPVGLRHCLSGATPPVSSREKPFIWVENIRFCFITCADDFLLDSTQI